MESENKALAKINRYYLTENRKPLYIALEEMDFTWSTKDVKEFDKLWKKGKSLVELAKHFNRTTEEVAVLVMDRALKDKIKPR